MTATMLLSAALCAAFVAYIALLIAYLRNKSGLVQLTALHEAYRTKVESLRLPSVVFGELGSFVVPDPLDAPGVVEFETTRDGTYLPVDIGAHTEALYLVARYKDGGPAPPHLKQIITLLRTLSA